MTLCTKAHRVRLQQISKDAFVGMNNTALRKMSDIDVWHRFVNETSSAERELLLICDNYMKASGAADCDMNLSQFDGLNHPLIYRVVATLLHVIIFIGGVAGNIVVIIVARRTKALRKPTYCYLVRKLLCNLKWLRNLWQTRSRCSRPLKSDLIKLSHVRRW